MVKGTGEAGKKGGRSKGRCASKEKEVTKRSGGRGRRPRLGRAKGGNANMHRAH